MENQLPFSALVVLFLSLSWVYMDDMDDRVVTFYCTCSGCRTWCPVVAVSGGLVEEGEKIWAATENKRVS